LRFSEKRNPGLLTGLGLLIFISAVALAYKPFTTIFTAVKSDKPAYDRSAEVAQLRALLLSISSAERGFTATGDPEYRAAYFEAAPRMLHIIDDLKTLHNDDPGQKLRFVQLSDLVNKRLALAEEAVRAQEAVDPAQISEEDGLVREIGTLLSETENEENAGLTRMEGTVRESMLIILFLGVAGVSVSLLVIILALGFMKREGARRSRTEENAAGLLRTAEQAGDLITIIDQNGTIEFMNKAAEEATGYERNKLVGTRSKAWFPWYSDKQFLRAMRETVLSGRPFESAATGRKKNGELFFVNEVVTPLVDRGGRITRIISTARDITRQKQLEERLDYLEKYDPLTGIPNRKYFVDMMEQEIVSAKEGGRFLSVIIIDIDRSKHINDLFGSEAGDAVLKWISEKLRAAVSPRDIIARLGSDEFAVLHFDDSRPVVAVYSENGKDAHSLLTNAEDRITTGVSEAFYFEKRLFSALKKDEYLVRYQPYCDLANQKVAGAEALIK
jgi:diguanylate cyclase (GGDEF)-like protein/PAS domain S-box-containing protein